MLKNVPFKCCKILMLFIWLPTGISGLKFVTQNYM